MERDPELAALIEQALRNASTLELLARRTGGDGDVAAILELQTRLAALKVDYTKETDALTRHVLRRALDRRSGPDRRGALDETRDQEAGAHLIGGLARVGQAPRERSGG